MDVALKPEHYDTVVIGGADRSGDWVPSVAPGN
jgi:hypothetical protein